MHDGLPRQRPKLDDFLACEREELAVNKTSRLGCLAKLDIHVDDLRLTCSIQIGCVNNRDFSQWNIFEGFMNIWVIRRRATEIRRTFVHVDFSRKEKSEAFIST